MTSGSVVAHTGIASDQLSASASSGQVALTFTARPERLTIGVGSGSARITVPAGTRYHIVSSAGSGLVSLVPGLSNAASGQVIAVSVGAGEARIGYPAGSR